jgi:CBS domain containing-hemolysin-like protein
MTPRVKIEALPSSATISEAMEFYLTHTHSRIPVYNETIDKIDHFLTARDLVKEFASGNTSKSIADMNLKQVLKVPLNQSIAKLLETFQQSHKIMAIIIDEYGGVSGLITMEDIIEEVFGEIRDESDKEIDEIKQIGANSIQVESDVLAEDMLEELNLDLEHIGLDEREFGGETLSYVITHVLE